MWLRKKDLAFGYFIEILLSCSVPTSRGKKVVNMVVTRASHSFY